MDVPGVPEYRADFQKKIQKKANGTSFAAAK
jgi:hypothetical protein